MHLLVPYKGLIVLLLVFTLFSNGINLFIPKIIAGGIDAFTAHHFVFRPLVTKFTLAVAAIFIFTYLQGILQTYASEKVARDLRTKLAGKISQQSYAFIEQVTPGKILTNLTADVDSIKITGHCIHSFLFVYHHRSQYIIDHY